MSAVEADPYHRQPYWYTFTTNTAGNATAVLSGASTTAPAQPWCGGTYTGNVCPVQLPPAQAGYTTTMQQPNFQVVQDTTSGQWQTIPFTITTGTSAPTTVTIPFGDPYHQNPFGYTWQIPPQPETGTEMLDAWFNENPHWRTYFTEETPEVKAQKAKALEKSRELAKEWLSEKEFKALEEQGEIEIPSTKKDILYIVKKDPMRRVVKRVVKRMKGALVNIVISKMDIEEFCIHPLDPSLPLYDAVLSKVLLIKGDEKLFEESANKTVLPVPIAR